MKTEQTDATHSHARRTIREPRFNWTRFACPPASITAIKAFANSPAKCVKRMEKQKQWQQGMTQRKLTVRNGRIHCHCEDGQQHDHFEIHSSSVFHSARAPGLTGGGTRLLLNPRRARSPASDAARGERERGRELMRPPLAYIYCPLAQPPVETLAANQNNQCPRAVSPASHCLLCPVCKWHERIR